MSKNQNTPLSTFLKHKKHVFQHLGHVGCIVSASILGVLAVSFVAGMTLVLTRSPSVSVHAWAGPMRWGYAGGFFAAFMAAVSMWGYVCFNAVLLHRLFCAYKKGNVFSMANSQRLILLGLFNLFLGSILAGLFALALAIILPDTEAS